jgi:Na+/H+-dicarboxylate symporter
MRNRLTAYILTGMVLGVIVGFVANLWVGGDEALAKDVAGYFHLLADIFLHLIKMIIAPLVFSTLVAGIAHMGDSAALGRIGGRRSHRWCTWHGLLHDQRRAPGI